MEPIKDFLSGIVAFLSLKNTLVFTCVGLVIGGLFVYYRYNERVFEKMLDSQVKLLAEVKDQKELIETNNRDHSFIVNRMIDFEKLKLDSLHRTERLTRAVLRDSKHKKSFEEITKAKPKLVERKINNATKKYFDGIEHLINSGKLPQLR